MHTYVCIYVCMYVMYVFVFIYYYYLLFEGGGGSFFKKYLKAQKAKHDISLSISTPRSNRLPATAIYIDADVRLKHGDVISGN